LKLVVKVKKDATALLSRVMANKLVEELDGFGSGQARMKKITNHAGHSTSMWPRGANSVAAHLAGITEQKSGE
jgi:hypothetical protein